MSGSNINAADDHIRRLENQLREKQIYGNEIIGKAEAAGRDLTDNEREMLNETRGRIEEIKTQLETVEDFTRTTFEVMNRQRQVQQAADRMRRGAAGVTAGGLAVEYRNIGEYVWDQYRAALGNREAVERLEIYTREADHTVTGENPGIVPDPIIGPVLNFIDTARPLVNALGPRPLPGASWYRPHVKQHTTVARQGSAGAAADEKAELVSQALQIERLNGTATTYGGYANVSRQVMDFSTPDGFQAVVQDLSGQYAIETEAAVGDALASTLTSPVSYVAGSGQTVGDAVSGAVWEAVATAYTAVAGQGSLYIAISPDVLGTFGPVFAPYGPTNQQGQGFMANNFGQGIMGYISGVPVMMSAGLGAGEAFLFSSAAVECYEQKIGQLSVVEPSVLGVQVSYSGYFSTLVINDDAVIPLSGTGS